MASLVRPLSGTSCLLGLLVLTLSCSTTSAQLTVGCPNRGCGPGQRFHMSSEAGVAVRLPAAVPHMAWTWRTRVINGMGFPQCTVAKQGGVVCTGNLTGGMGGIVSLSVYNGTQQWLDMTLDATQTSPVLSTSGDAISCDGRALVGTQADGRPIGPPVPLFLPGLYSLDLTAESIIPLVARFNFDCTPDCGKIVTWLADGVPHASASMNDSQTGEAFTAAAMPLINVANKTQDATTRIYIVTAAVPISPSPLHHQAEGLLVPCRLEAWDVASTMNNRLEQAWYFPFHCQPPDWHSKDSPPLPIMLLNNTVVLGGSLSADDVAINLLAVADDGPAPRLASVTYLGKFSSAVASLSFQPETDFSWATEILNRSILLGVRLATSMVTSDDGRTKALYESSPSPPADFTVAYQLQRGESLVSPVMTVASSTGEPALLFLVAGPPQTESERDGGASVHSSLYVVAASVLRSSEDAITPAGLSPGLYTTKDIWRVTIPISGPEVQRMVKRFGSVGQPLLIDRAAAGGNLVVVATESMVYGLN